MTSGREATRAERVERMVHEPFQFALELGSSARAYECAVENLAATLAERDRLREALRDCYSWRDPEMPQSLCDRMEMLIGPPFLTPETGGEERQQCVQPTYEEYPPSEDWGR